MTDKVKIRGLVRVAGWMFLVWGAVVSVKGLLDAFILMPESEFVPMDKWVKYAGFEACYGLACVAVAGLLFAYGRRVPEWIERPKSPESSLL